MSDRIDIFFTEFRRMPHNKELDDGSIQTHDGRFGVFVFTGPRETVLELEFNNKMMVDYKNVGTPKLERVDIDKILDAIKTEAFKTWVFDPNPDCKTELEFMDCYDV